MIVNRQELSQAMGISLPTVDRWIRDGCPVKQRGAKGVAWEFLLPDVVAWWGNRQREAAGGAVDDIKEIDKRTARAKMEQAELALAKERGLVAPVREFERAQAAMFAAIRTNIMNVPQRVVVQLLGETDEATFKQKLRAELTLALDTSANAELALDDDENEDGDDERD
jgi:phage terminase Nu1 subunit (DNA packaging protein)